MFGTTITVGCGSCARGSSVIRRSIKPWAMPDHLHYEELTALSAGGHLTAPEREELRQHMAGGAECRESARVYRDIVVGGLPLTRDTASERQEADAAPDPGARERFLARARSEGVSFSPELDAPAATPRRFP